MIQKPSYQELERKVRQLEAGKTDPTQSLVGFIENSAVGFYRSTPEGRFCWVNKAFAHMLGYDTPGDLVKTGNEIQDRFFVNRQDRDHRMALIRENGMLENHEFEIQQRNGDRIWISETARARYDETGGITAFEGMVFDITRRKTTEAAGKEAETFIRSLLNSLPVPVFYKDRDGRYRGFNSAFETFYGQKRKHLIGKSVFDLGPRDLAQVYQSKDNALFESGGNQRYESQVENAQGQVRDVMFDKSVYRDSTGQVAGLIGTVLDITDRKRYEQALQESEARFRAVFDGANDGILAACAATKQFVMANTIICRMLGYDKDELCQLSVYDIHPEDQVPEIIRAFETLAAEKVQMVESIPVKRKDGSVFYADINASPVVVGKETLLVGVFRDITQRRKMETALRKSEEQFRELAELLPGAVVETDIEGNISYANRMGMKMFGYTEADIAAGLNGLDLISKGQRQKAAARLKDRISRQSLAPTEYRMITKDKKEIWIFLNASPIVRNGTLEGFRAVLMNISERKAIEKERETLIGELQDALAEIKTLKGIVPICSKCKKIRDDQGYWNILETFIQEHSEASFSHSICPDCSDKLYGKENWYQKMKEKNKSRKDR